MKTFAKFKEYIWLVNTIHKYRKITFAELQEKWLDSELSEGVELARATFNRHKAAVEEMFGILIECDKKDGYRYYIDNEEVLRENTVQNWMLSTMSVHNVISESLSLQDRILLEQVPSQGEFLHQVIEAMKQKVKICVTYQKYGFDDAKVLLLEPYCIKLFRQRWYLLGHFHREASAEKSAADFFSVYSFDRIKEMSLTDEGFEVAPDFCAADYFRESFGVMVMSEVPPERVVIRAFGKEGYYLNDLPLHASQRQVAQTADYSDFELYMRPTNDFCGHILSRGTQLKVLQPKWLVDKVRTMFLEGLKQYEAD